MGTPTQRVNLNELKADIVRIREKYLVVQSFGEYDSAGFIEAFARTAGRTASSSPRDMAILAKSTATLEDIIRTLHPEVDLVGIARPFLDDIVQRRLSPQRILGDMMSEATGLGSMLRTVPGQIDQLMHDFETGNIMVRAVTPAARRPAAPAARAGRTADPRGVRRRPPRSRPRSRYPRPPSPRRAWSRRPCSRSRRSRAGCRCSAWHWFGQGKPLKLTPLLRFFRR